MGFNFLGKNRIAVFVAVAFCIVMVLLPEVTANASKQGILLWLNSIVPTLLPFFIFAGFLKGIGVAERVSPVVYPFAMAVLSGYPMGARIVGDYCRQGLVDKERAVAILSYSMVTGPAFMIGAIGVEFLESYKCGVVLAVSHYLGALACGVFFAEKGNAAQGRFALQGDKSASKKRAVSQGEKFASQKRAVSQGEKFAFQERAVSQGEKFASQEINDLIARDKSASPERNYYNAFTDAIIDSFKSLAIILAYIVIFMIICEMFEYSGLSGLLSSEANAIIKGSLEMTVGCSSLVGLDSDTLFKTTLATFIVTFGGFSVLGQSMSMISGSSVEFLTVLKVKLLHGVLATIIAFSIGCFVL